MALPREIHSWVQFYILSQKKEQMIGWEAAGGRQSGAAAKLKETTGRAEERSLQGRGRLRESGISSHQISLDKKCGTFWGHSLTSNSFIFNKLLRVALGNLSLLGV